jgi:3-deoxy-D-manno-octulosonic-acid transferase
MEDHVAGDIARKAVEFPLIRLFCSGKITLIAGSIWPSDEEIIVRFINENKLPVRFILAPHEIHERGIRQLQESIKGKTARYSSKMSFLDLLPKKSEE